MSDDKDSRDRSEAQSHSNECHEHECELCDCWILAPGARCEGDCQCGECGRYLVQ